MDVAAELRVANLVVIPGRTGIGNPSAAQSIERHITGTPKADEGASDLNGIVIPARAVAYIERSGRVWTLADGPVLGNVAVIYVAAYREGDITDEQNDAAEIVAAVLSVAYDLAAPQTDPNAGDGQRDDDTADPPTTDL